MTASGELLELLQTAPTRFRALRASARLWTHPALYQRAREKSAGPGGRRFSAPSEPRVAEYRMWLAGPDRYRIEQDVKDATWVLVVDGERWWWQPPGQTVLADHDGRPLYYANPIRSELLAIAYISWLDYEVVGQAEHAGRPCVRVRALPRARAGWRSAAPSAMVGDERELLVDAERGLVMRFENRVDGQPFAVFELSEVAFDESWPDEMFTAEPPPEAPRQTWAEHLADSYLPLPEAAARTSFSVLVPERPPAGACPLVSYRPGPPRGPAESVTLNYHLPRARGLRIRQETSSLDPRGEAWERVEHSGRSYSVLESDRSVLVIAQWQDSTVSLSGRGLSREEVLDVAASLVPFTGETAEAQGDPGRKG